MKKLVALLVLLLAVLTALAALDFAEVDALYNRNENNQKVYDTLKTMLSSAKTDKEKSEVLWRLARVCVDLGDALPEKDKKGKFAIYEEGEEYAKQSIAASPNWTAYLWKCCNVGRWGQTKGALNSLSKVGPMQKDLKVVTDDFKVLDSSETWYTLGVLYDAVPGWAGGNSNYGISYARIACETIPAEVIYGNTYRGLAEMLYNRNWNASKRAKEIGSMQKKWDKETKSNYDKYAFYEGSKGADAVPLWSSKKLSEMTDREEALAILNYAQKVYESRSFRTASDTDNYNEIKALIASWSK